MVEATELAAQLETALESIEVALMDGLDGTMVDKIRLFNIVKALNGHKSRSLTIADTLEELIVENLGEPVPVDGLEWKAKRRPSRKGFDKEALRDKATRIALADTLDEATGELASPTAGEAVERVWVLADVATGRTAKFAAAGIDLDEYAVTTWRTRLEGEPPTDKPDKET